MVISYFVVTKKSNALFSPFEPADWSYRKKITIDSDMVEEDLSFFPVLIRLNDADLLSARADGLDIIFADSSANMLDFEIESYDGAGNLSAWVLIPSLSSSVDTEIYIYYGNPVFDMDLSFAYAVWSEYELAYHMADATDLSYEVTDIYATIGAPTRDDGYIGAGLSFDGNDAWNMRDITYWEQEWYSREHEAVIETGNDVTTRQTILAEGGGTNGMMIYIVDGNLYARWWVEGQGWIGGHHSYPVSANTAYHVVANYEYPGSYNLYVNGVLIGSTATTVKMAGHTGNGGIAYTGAGSKDYHDLLASSGNYFLGSIHELKVLDTIRSNGWITTEYNNQRNPSSFYTVYGEEKVNSDISDWYGYWNLNEGSGSVVNDSWVAGNDGTIFDATWAGEINCLDGDCLSFDSSYNNYVNVGSENYFDYTTEDLTVMAWVKIQGEFGTDRPILAKGNQWRLGIDSDEKAYFSWDDGVIDTIVSDSTLSPNTWYHVVGQRFGRGTYLYVNGVRQVDEGTIDDAISSSESVNIGRAGVNYFDGLIDEVRIYNSFLFPSEIADIYDLNKPTVAVNSDVTGYAWSSNIGWISFSCENDSSCATVDYGVAIDETTGDFSGYAWSDSVGWIDFAPTGPYPETPDYSANYNLLTGQVTGWAKVISLGDSEEWIKMNGTWSNGVEIDGSTGDFSGWAWSGATTGKGIGWISFDCENDSTCAIANYGVNYDIGAIPDVSPISVSWPNKCLTPPNALTTLLTFDYSDSVGLDGSAYQIVLSKTNDSENPTEFDTGKCTGVGTCDSCADPAMCTMDITCMNGTSVCQYNINSADMEYGQTYYWWVKVWNSSGVESSLAEATSFETYQHEFPAVDFTWDPTTIRTFDDIQFEDLSTLDGGATLNNVLWTVPVTATIDDDSSQTPIIIFNSSDEISVMLRVEDSDGYICTKTTDFNIEHSLPKWEETVQ